MSDWITRRQAAAHVGVSVETIDRWIKRGYLTRHKPGGRLVALRRSELDAYIESTAARRRRRAA